MKRIGLGIILTGFLFVTSGYAKEEYTFKNQLNPSELQWSKIVGNSSVKGMGIFRTAEGEMKSCAGKQIFYYPYSAYILEDFQARIRGYKQFKNLDLRLTEYSSSVPCNMEGEFSVSNLPSGKWIFVMNIPVVESNSKKSSYNLATDLSDVSGEGHGIFYRIVTVKSGETEKISLIQGDSFAH